MPKLADLTLAEREELLALLEERRLRDQAKAAEQSLHEFMKMFWRVVDPEEEFVDGWPVEAICIHLEATEDGTIKRLIINVPPGFSKSLLVDVFLPAWLWGPRGRPWLRFIAASYSASLTERDNGRFSRLIQDPVYRRFWGNQFNLTRDGMTKVENDRTGWKLATSVGGVGTGERGNYILIDDPNNPLDVESDTVRGTTNQWLREIMPDRLNNLREGIIIVIQQRTHEEDATGTLLKYGTGYAHLMIDMRFDVRLPRIPTPIDWVDPREYEGELAWEERFPEDVCDAMEKIKGPFGWSGQYQQQPVPRGGGIIPREMWNLWPAPGYECAEGEKQQFPEVSFVLMCADTASTEKEENDPSACVVFGVWHDMRGRPKVIMMDAWAERLKINALVAKYMETGKKRLVDRMLVENKNNGISVAHEMQRLMVDAEFGVEIWEPKGHGDKVARLYAVQPTFDRGDVYAPDKKWANKVIDEVLQVPKGAHDDLADCCFVAGTMIATRRGDVPIERILVDDLVLTPAGWRRVTIAKQTRRTEVISRFGLTGTAGHPTFTLDESVVRLDTVSSEKMLSRLSLCGLIRATHMRPFSSMGLSTAAWAAGENITSRKPARTMAASEPRASMSPSGNTSLARKFLSAMRSITSTATRSISISTIWSVYRLACIEDSLKGRPASNCGNISPGSAPLPRLGTGLRMAACGMWHMVSPLSRLLGRQKRPLLSVDLAFATGAERSLSPELIDVGIADSHVRQRVQTVFEVIGHQRSASLLSMIFAAMPGHASGAEPRRKEANAAGSARQNAATSAQDGGMAAPNSATPIMRPVYNLQIEEAEAYYANGILVHNCSMGLLWLRESGMLKTNKEFDDAFARAQTFQREPEPLYDV